MTVHLTEILHAIQTQQVGQPDLFLLLTFQITYLWKLHLSLSKLTTIMETNSCLNPLVMSKGCCFHSAAPDYQGKAKFAFANSGELLLIPAFGPKKGKVFSEKSGQIRIDTGSAF